MLSWPVLQRADAVFVQPEATQSQESDTEEGTGGGDSSDEEGWITPSNLQQIQQDMGQGAEEPAGVQVGCVTTDFAMQASVGCGGSVRLAPQRLLTPPHVFFCSAFQSMNGKGNERLLVVVGTGPCGFPLRGTWQV